MGGERVGRGRVGVDDGGREGERDIGWRNGRGGRG